MVLGAGLAGSAMAWNANWSGLSVMVIDRLDASSASRVAAGLVTPITGSRAAASWRWNEFFPIAEEFYRRVEEVTQSHFWKQEPALRFFRNRAEHELYQSKWLGGAALSHKSEVQVSGFSEADFESTSEAYLMKAPFGSCVFAPAARLDTKTYLEETQAYFEARDAFCQIHLDCDRDIVIDPSHVDNPIRIESLDLAAKRIVLCQGVAARENLFFADLPLHPARGDILMVESIGLRLEQVVHHDAWVVPLGLDRYLVGATYDRFALHARVDLGDSDAQRFRRELMARWEALVSGTFASGQHRVLEQRAAVRPASYDRHPLLGCHDAHSNVYCLNGLGSKGTLMAPLLAQMTLQSMQGIALDPKLSRSRRK